MVGKKIIRGAMVFIRSSNLPQIWPHPQQPRISILVTDKQIQVAALDNQLVITKAVAVRDYLMTIDSQLPIMRILITDHNNSTLQKDIQDMIHLFMLMGQLVEVDRGKLQW